MGLSGRLVLSRGRRSMRPPTGQLALAVGLSAGAIVVAFVATERLADRSPLVAVGLALLLVLPAWMVFSTSYGLTLAALLLYLGLVDGPLKLLLDNGVATLGRDVLLYSIVLGALARMAIEARPLRFPPLTGYVLVFVVIVAVQLLNPGTEGIARGLAATRPHVEFIPLFFFGYLVMRDARRLRMFLFLLCVIAAANGVVSLVQFNLTPDQLASWGPGYDKLINGTGNVSGRVFYDDATKAQFVRPFGLGPDSGFGGFVGVLAVPGLLALLATTNRRWAWRLGAPLGVGILLAIATSQARSGVVAAIVALLAFVVLALSLKRRSLILVAIACVVTISVGVVWALSGTDNSAALGRYGSLSPTDVVGATLESRGRSLEKVPDYVVEFPFGAGLGQVGPGSTFRTRAVGVEPLNGETEFNYLLVELGVIGLLVFGALNLRLLALSARLRKVRDHDTRLLLAGCAAPLFGIASAWITGAVSAGTPISPYLWFMAGVLAFWLLRPGRPVGDSVTVSSA